MISVKYRESRSRRAEKESQMKKRPLLSLLLLMGLVLACDLPMSATATPVILVPALATPAGGEEIATPIGTAVATALGAGPVGNSPVLLVTATPVIVATPTVPMVTPLSVSVNCRAGPDLAYDSVSVLAFGASTPVAGRTADASWWYVQDPANPSGFCWVNSSVVGIAGPTAGIPVAALPAAIANQVTVAISAPATAACNPPTTVMLSGSIATNGAATVQYQWEITGSQMYTTPPQTLVFATAGTQNVTDPNPYTVGCGSYSAALHVTSPNDLSATKAFQIAEP
jgi:hypothetical protein